MTSLRVLVLLLVALAATAVFAADPSKDFEVGVEDVLQIFVWGESELSLSVKVRPDGKITVPLVHDIHVVGMTTAEIRQIVTEKLSVYVREPNVTVMLSQINSYRVYLLGEVRNAGTLQLYSPTRILQLIAMAGGLTEFSKKEITILRQEKGVEKRIRVDAKRLLVGDPAQENVMIQPGDTLLFK